MRRSSLGHLVLILDHRLLAGSDQRVEQQVVVLDHRAVAAHGLQRVEAVEPQRAVGAMDAVAAVRTPGPPDAPGGEAGGALERRSAVGQPAADDQLVGDQPTLQRKLLRRPVERDLALDQAPRWSRGQRLLAQVLAHD